MKKTWAILLAVVLTICSLSFAAAESPVTLRFSWWGGDARHQATLEAIELYESLHPDVKIEAEYSGVDGYQEKLYTQLASGNAPDIIQVDAWWSDAQSKFNCFASMDEVGVDYSGFDTTFLEGNGVIDGVVYALPTGMNAPMMLINRDVLDAAGIEFKDEWTWDEINEIGAKVHEQNPDQYFFSLEQYTVSWYVLRAYLSQLSGNPTIIDETYELGFTYDECVEAFNFIKTLYDNGVIQPASEGMVYFDAPEQNPLWINGNAAATMNWTSKFNDLKGTHENLAVITLPTIGEAAKNTGMFSRPSQLICINNASANIEAAADFVNFFYGDEAALKILGDVRSVPATVKGREVCQKENLIEALVLEATSNATLKPGTVDCVLASDTSLIDIVYSVVEDLAYGNMSPEEAAESLMERLNERLEEIK